MPRIGRTAFGAAVLAAGAVLSATAPTAATPLHSNVVPATTAHAQPCGYNGYIDSSHQPVYTHCGTGSVVIEVDHFFWDTTYACMPTGSWHIPQGDSQWAIYDAEADGHTCVGGPIALERP